ncbi:MAG: tol-pal system protein YbgF [Thermodesulfovibrionales bacterium]
MRAIALLSYCFVLFLITGCVTTSDFDSLRNDVNFLKRETFELRKETSDLRKDINSLKEQSTGVVKEESFNAIRESQTMLLSRISDLSKDLQILSGRFEESKFFIDKSFKEWNTEKELMRGQINSLEARLKELNDKITKLSEQKPLPTQGPEESQKTERPSEEKREGEPLKAYEQAYELYKEKKYKEARDRFNHFLKDFPKSDLADNAQFWIGETYYAEKDFEGAILAYENVIKNFPQSEKLPGAMLKQGMAFLELGDKKTAKVIFERLIEKFPDSKEAEAAKKKKTELQGTIKKKR